MLGVVHEVRASHECVSQAGRTTVMACMSTRKFNTLKKNTAQLDIYKTSQRSKQFTDISKNY